MPSKTRIQRQKKKAKLAAGITAPTQLKKPKSIHEKKTLPNMKGKMKIRRGHQSADIYEGFENKKGVLWTCPTCEKTCHVVGYCAHCNTTSTGKAVPKAKLLTAEGVLNDRATKEAMNDATKNGAVAAPKHVDNSTASGKKKKKLQFKTIMTRRR